LLISKSYHYHINGINNNNNSNNEKNNNNNNNNNNNRGSFGLWNIAFLIFGIVLLQKGYEANRTNSFISLDRTAGDCLEVPQTVTGSFVNDANGVWNTNSHFKNSLSQSVVSLLGLTYTTDQWKANMQEIENQVLAIVSKTPFRDFSWNVIAWSSYKAVYTTSGRLEFAFDASSSTIFNKDYPAMGLGSAKGVLNQDIGNPSTCSQLMVYLFNLIYNFIITTSLLRLYLMIRLQVLYKLISLSANTTILTCVLMEIRLHAQVSVLHAKISE